MKRISLLLALLVAFTYAATAQVDPTVLKQATGKAYVASQKDTSKAYRIAAANYISAVFHTLDSAVVYRKVQYCKSSADYSDANWTTVNTDTITTTAAGYSELVIRDGDTELLNGVYGWVRLIYTFAAAANGVTTATYDNWIAVRQ